MNVFRRFALKRYHNQFCKQFVKRVNALSGYSAYLKHYSKKESLKSDCYNVALYDVLDNTGFNKLIRRIQKLKRRKNYNVELLFKPHKIRTVNYIHSNLLGRSIGHVARIKLKDNDWISEISISYTYLNNSEAIIEYSFQFKKIINSSLKLHQFVADNILSVKKELYFHSYADREIVKKAACQELMRLDDIFFADILQAYICNLFYTKYGRQYKLPVEYALRPCKYNKKIRKKLRKVFLCGCYEKEHQHMIVSTLNYDRFEIHYFRVGKYLPSVSMLNYFSAFPTETYYMLFGHIEIIELERHMRKYLNSSNTFIAAHDLKWLVNKIRYIQEKEQTISDELAEENRKYIDSYLGWDCYSNGVKVACDFINYPNITKRFKTLYEQNLSYLNAISNVQNNSAIIIVTLATFITTIVGIVVSLMVK